MKLSLKEKRERTKNKIIETIAKEQEFELIEPFVYKDSKTKISILHKQCGQVFKVTSKNFLQHNSRCPKKECVVEKTKRTNLKRYGVPCSLQNESVRNKSIKTNLKKYGVKCPLLNSEVNKKRKETMVERYGAEYTLQSEQLFDKVKKTNLEKYGVENSLLSPEVNKKRKKTMVERYGAEYTLQSEELFNRVKTTNLEKYGVEYGIQNEHIKNKVKETIKKNYLERKNKTNRFPEKPSSVEMRYYRYYSSCRKDYNVELLSSIDSFCRMRGEKFKYKCLKCDYSYTRSHPPVCRKCNPCKIGSGISNQEKEICDFISSIGVECESNSRFSYVNGRYEIDIFIPSLNIGFEHDGLYWHSEISGGKKRDYHLDKQVFFKGLGIDVFFIRGDEWINKDEIIKSIILTKLGKSEKIYARKTKIKDVSHKECKKFLEENHIQGSIISKIRLGLYHEGELVSVVSFGKSRFNSRYEYELHRYCNKINTSVVGGFSKLFKYFVRNYNPKSIITYSDKRFFDGSIYKNNGFSPLRDSKPNYWYIDSNYTEVYSRMKFQKHKLNKVLMKFDKDKSEFKNMLENGYDRIWDCGNKIYLWEAR